MSPACPALTVKEVAEMLSISVPTVFKHVHTPGFPRGFKIGKARRWTRQEILDYVETRQEKMQKQR